MRNISHVCRGFVCINCGEFNEIDDDMVGACDCEHQAEAAERERRERKLALIDGYRALLVWARYRAKESGRRFRFQGGHR